MAHSRTKISGALIKSQNVTDADLALDVGRGASLDFLNLKSAISNSFVKYNVKDGIMDRFQDASGVDASGSTNEIYDTSGKYYTGTNIGSYSVDAFDTITRRSGNALTKTGTKKIGTASAYFNGGEFIYVGPDDLPGIKLGDTTASWTIEFWVYLNNISSDYVLMDHRANTMANGGWSFYTDVSEGGVGFDRSNGSAWSVGLQDPTANTLSQWYHYAVVQVGGSTLKMYRDGTEVDSTTTLMSDASGTYIEWLIGGGYNNGGNHSNNYFSYCYLDEVRVSKVARYTSNFTPSTTAFTSDNDTLLLMHMDGADNGTDFPDSRGWTAPANTSQAEVLVVGAGGGGAGEYYAGGGGGGGIVHDVDYAVTAGTLYDVTIGKGGTGGNASTMGGDGDDSVWNVNTTGGGITLTASGGGGSSYNSGTGGKAGGSGGGGGGGSGSAGGPSDQASFPGATSYGNAGGTSDGSNGAGGGGAGGAGTNSVHPNGGPGGVGKEFTNFAAYGTDASNTSGAIPGSGSGKGYFGGGGGGSGGGHTSPTQATGGAGGGGGGGRYTPATLAVYGYSATGGGGGGGSHSGNGGPYGQGRAGGSGIVLIRHRTETYNNMTLVSNATTAEAQPDSARVTLLRENAVGTTTTNTDIKAYASRDNGTTYTQITLDDSGDYDTNKSVLSGGVDISGQPAGTSMRYKIETLNQSSTKQTRIYGVGFVW